MMLLYLSSARLKALVVLLVIIVLMIPVYGGMKWLNQRIRPRDSASRFLLWLLAGLAWIFLATALIVLAIRLLFTGSN